MEDPETVGVFLLPLITLSFDTSPALRFFPTFNFPLAFTPWIARSSAPLSFDKTCARIDVFLTPAEVASIAALNSSVSRANSLSLHISSKYSPSPPKLSYSAAAEAWISDIGFTFSCPGKDNWCSLKDLIDWTIFLSTSALPIGPDREPSSDNVGVSAKLSISLSLSFSLDCISTRWSRGPRYMLSYTLIFFRETLRILSSTSRFTKAAGHWIPIKWPCSDRAPRLCTAPSAGEYTSGAPMTCIDKMSNGTSFPVRRW